MSCRSLLARQQSAHDCCVNGVRHHSERNLNESLDTTFGYVVHVQPLLIGIERRKAFSGCAKPQARSREGGSRVGNSRTVVPYAKVKAATVARGSDPDRASLGYM